MSMYLSKSRALRAGIVVSCFGMLASAPVVAEEDGFKAGNTTITHPQLLGGEVLEIKSRRKCLCCAVKLQKD